jgi:hypothetical protein
VGLRARSGVEQTSLARTTARRRSRQRTSLPRLQPNEGRWVLDWALVDRTGPFPWPNRNTRLYKELAAYLARHNELSLTDVLAIERTNGKSAHHAVKVEDLSQPAKQQFDVVYRRNALDESVDADVHVLVMSLCRAARDPRRVICLFSGVQRKMLPLWWDPLHEVTGNRGRGSKAAACPGDCLHE